VVCCFLAQLDLAAWAWTRRRRRSKYLFFGGLSFALHDRQSALFLHNEMNEHVTMTALFLCVCVWISDNKALQPNSPLHQQTLCIMSSKAARNDEKPTKVDKKKLVIVSCIILIVRLSPSVYEHAQSFAECVQTVQERGFYLLLSYNNWWKRYHWTL
jgi:hypothetical protein